MKTTPRSVRFGILASFGILIAIITVIVGGAVVTVLEYQSATAEMQKRANLASELQTAEANGSVAALLLQRYVVAGDETLVTEIQFSAAATVQALDRASALAEATDTNSTQSYETLTDMTARSEELVAGAQQVIEDRQDGNVEAAAARIEAIVPTFREFRLQLIELADTEVAEVDRLQQESNQAGNVALWLLIISGVLGSLLAIAVAVAVARSIIKPLTRLEDVALSVALGDMKARAPVSGPRELKQLAESLNMMTSTAHQRTEELRLSNEELKQRNRQLLDARYQAATDPLTGLLNHRSFHESIKDVVTRHLQDGGKVTAIMIDIDNFKSVNDSLGHLAGDNVLRDIASAISSVVGEAHAYRYGGDEFAILLPGVGRTEALATADNLLKAVKSGVRTAANGSRATVSIGVACFPDMAASAEELFYRADMALNWAKSKGKNRIAGWDEVQAGTTIVLPDLAVPNPAGE
jgi:diguanylate cyclase (GGDEF)-like protein